MSSRGAPGAPIIVTEASGVTFGHLRHSLLAARRGVFERPTDCRELSEHSESDRSGQIQDARGLFANLLSLAGRQAESDESSRRSVRENDGNRRGNGGNLGDTGAFTIRRAGWSSFRNEVSHATGFVTVALRQALNDAGAIRRVAFWLIFRVPSSRVICIRRPTIPLSSALMKSAGASETAQRSLPERSCASVTRVTTSSSRSASSKNSTGP